MGISLVIPTWNGLDHLVKLFASLGEVEFADTDEIIVCDGNSSDGTQDFIRAVAESSSVTVKLVALYKNFGFGGNINAGLKEMREGNDVVILNNDVVITNPDVFQLLWEEAYANPKLGIVSPIQLGLDGRIQAHGAGQTPFSHLGKTWSAGELPVGQYPGLRECEVVPFVCVFIKRDCLADVGPFNEEFFAYFEDSDYCLRAGQAGWKVGSLGSVSVLHTGPGSTAYRVAAPGELYRQSHQIFKRIWSDALNRRFSHSVVWVGTSSLQTGYGFWSRHAQRAALDAGVLTHYQPGRLSPELDPPTGDIWLDDCRNHVGDPDMPQVIIEHASRFPRASGRYRIGYTMSDVDHWPKEWLEGCPWVDEIWVPTQIDRQRLIGSGITLPITVMPLGVDPGYFHPDIRPWAERPGVDFLFVSVFMWCVRKNPDLLIRAFRDEFSRSENVGLFIKTHPGLAGERIEQQTRWWMRKPSAPVFIYQHAVPDFALGGIYTQADCFVLPTSGEGWGLPPLEALACGIPVIVTGWSAPTEWGMNEQGAPLPGMHFINYEYVGCRSDMVMYRDSSWAMPDYDHLRKLMREAYENRNEWKAAALEGSRIVREKYTWTALGERIQERIAAVS
jgi:GT2 family glycosyltransferase/glycosyltransferase involved in cell wall biosynthesis